MPPLPPTYGFCPECMRTEKFSRSIAPPVLHTHEDTIVELKLFPTIAKLRKYLREFYGLHLVRAAHNHGIGPDTKRGVSQKCS